MMRFVRVVLAAAALFIGVVAIVSFFERPANGPAFALIEYFQTPTTGEGTIRALDFSVDRFAVTTQGSREGEAGRMLERFVHTDGRRRLQDWTLRFFNGRDGTDGYIATRPDLKSPSIFRPLGANTYTYTWHQWLEPKTKSDLVTLRGWVSRQSDGSLVNRAVVFKWLFPVAIVRVAFRPTQR